MEKVHTLTGIDTVFELLAATSPDIKSGWEKHLTNYYKDNPERLLYFDMMEISAIVIRLFQHNKTKDLTLFFEAVEDVLKDCDTTVENLMLAGLIEGIQQICPYQDIDMRTAFDSWLQPLTKKNWDELTGFYKF